MGWGFREGRGRNLLDPFRIERSVLCDCLEELLEPRCHHPRLPRVIRERPPKVLWGHVWEMCGRCVGDVWEMRGRCAGDMWEMRGRYGTCA